MRQYLSSCQEKNDSSKVTIDKGMPIEQVQHLSGHVRIDTTLQYAIVNQNNVKIAHKRYLG